MDKLDFSQINTSNARALQQQYVAEKKGKPPGAPKESVQPPAQPNDGGVKSPRKYTQKEQGLIAGVLNRSVAAAAPPDPDAEKRKLAKLKARKIRQIQDYKSRKIFGDKFDHIKVPPASASLETIEVALEEIHEICASEGAENIIRQAPVVGAYAMEYMAKIGYLSLHLEGFGAVISGAPEELEPALTETVIEMKPFFSSPYYMRLIAGMGGLAIHYSSHMAPARTASVSQATVEKNADL